MSLHLRAGSPFWQYDFAINGKRFRGSTGQTGKREAARVEFDNKQAARIARQRTSAWRIRDTLGHYWNERAQYLNSCDTAFARLEALYRILGRDHRTTDITGAMLLDYRARRRGEGVGDSTVNRELSMLRTAIKHAAEIHHHPGPTLAWSQLRRKEPDVRIRYLSREEYAKLIEVAHESVRPIILTAVATGLRKQTILSLEWRQIDLEGGMISVVGKGGKQHIVRIAGPLKAALAALPSRKDNKPFTRVFDTRNARKRFDAAVHDAGLADFRFHDLRHTFATWARMAGADIAAIKDALDHADITTTMRYAHVMPEENVTAFDRVAAALTPQITTQPAKSA